MNPQPAPRETVPVLREALAVWLAIAAVAIAVLVTYARLPPSELYNVSEEGLTLGLGRTLVFLNFPIALAAVPLALVAAAILARPAATVAALLVAASAGLVPFVVDQSDLDAKPANAVPAAGVALALVLTLVAARGGLRAASVRLLGDRLRVALAALLLIMAVPWIFAELGFYAPDPILADEPSPGEPLAAVHLGHHHGTDGVLLALFALALSRVPPRLPAQRLAGVISAYVALMLVYGLANAVQDAWLEQVVKRGTTVHAIPSFLIPRLSAAWAILLVVAALVELVWFRRERRAVRAAAGEWESTAVRADERVAPEPPQQAQTPS